MKKVQAKSNLPDWSSAWQGSQAPAMKKDEVTGSRVQAVLWTHFACHYDSAQPNAFGDVGGNLV